MSVNTEITRIQSAKADIAKAIKYRKGGDVSNNLIDTYPSSINKLDGISNYIPLIDEVIHYTGGGSLYDKLCETPLWFKYNANLYVKISPTSSGRKNFYYSTTSQIDPDTKQPIFTTWSTFTEGEWIMISYGLYVGFKGDSEPFSVSSSIYRKFLFANDDQGNEVVSPLYCGGNIMSLINWGDLSLYPYAFYNCFAYTKIETPPLLPSTKLSRGCYYSMFQNCYKLKYPPILPAKILENFCYREMFSYCYKMKYLPDLIAETFRSQCYLKMFEGCSSATRLKCMTYKIYDESTLYYTTNWLNDASPYGLIISPHSDVFETSSASGIPTGWDVTSHEYNMSDYTS